MAAKINPQQYEILKRCLVGWGKKEEEVDGLIIDRIQTDSDGNITVLSLYCNQLSGPIPSELGGLKALKSLGYGGNGKE